jgi:hypothetical protein
LGLMRLAMTYYQTDNILGKSWQYSIIQISDIASSILILFLLSLHAFKIAGKESFVLVLLIEIENIFGYKFWWLLKFTTREISTPRLVDLSNL